MVRVYVCPLTCKSVNGLKDYDKQKSNHYHECCSEELESITTRSQVTNSILKVQELLIQSLASESKLKRQDLNATLVLPQDW